MNRATLFALTATSLLCLTFALPSGSAAAEEKQRVSFKHAAENTRYTQQHTIDVGDVPGHQIRVYELHRDFPKDAPTINEVELKESWIRGLSDYVDTNGPQSIYNEYVMKNGDKIFARTTAVAQSLVNPDGTRKNISTAAGTITGGTGKFVGISGVLRVVNTFDPKAGFNEGQTEFEYSIPGTD